MTDDSTTNAAQRYWEGVHQDRDSPPGRAGTPNELLVRQVESLAPGTVLDLGCAEGADAMWLAERGWQVTAADVSGTAVRRAATRAAEAGLTEQIDFQQHDLSQTFPPGRFDLVSVQFLHSPVAAEGER